MMGDGRGLGRLCVEPCRKEKTDDVEIELGSMSFLPCLDSYVEL